MPPVDRPPAERSRPDAASDRFDQPTSEFLKDSVHRLRSSQSDRMETVRSRMREGLLSSLDDPAKAAGAAHSIVDGCTHE